jgi:glutamyl-tRNA synthetase
VTTGRFAPTPSGDLHLGNLRTALLAWCFARHGGGRFLIRVEDLTTGAAPLRTAEQLEDLATLGLDHDGPIVAQSDRQDRYAAALARLEAEGRTYRCFCSRRDIREAAAAPHGPSIEGGYPGTCRSLDAAEVDRRLAEGRPAATRLRAEATTVRVEDRIVGPIEEPVDDFVVRRADGVAAYNLAVVIDDADQGVDQVVRGDDLVHTTPRQVLVQQLLGLPTPQYVHVPLVYGSDGERLAKRHGAITLRDQLRAGHTTVSVLGRLAGSVGLAGAGEEVTAAQVLARFDPDSLRISEQLPDVPDVG